MRINTIGTPVVTLPERTLQVGGARAVIPVEARNPGTGEAAARAAAGAPILPDAPASAVVEQERRQQVRRGEDRRKHQVAVLIDRLVSGE